MVAVPTEAGPCDRPALITATGDMNIQAGWMNQVGTSKFISWLLAENASDFKCNEIRNIRIVGMV
jgi:hypothetical protein